MTMRFTIPNDQLRKAPFVGPKGGLWADAKHTIHWDPVKHGTAAPKFVASDMITSDKMLEITARLAKLPLRGLKKLLGEIEERERKIVAAGDPVPVSLARWERAVNTAIVAAKIQPPAKPTKPEQMGFTFTVPAPKTKTTDPESQTEPGPEATPQTGDGGLTPEAVSEPGWERMPEAKPKEKKKASTQGTEAVHAAVRALGGKQATKLEVTEDATSMQAKLDAMPKGSIVTWTDTTGYGDDTWVKIGTSKWTTYTGVDPQTMTTRRLAKDLAEQKSYRPRFSALETQPDTKPEKAPSKKKPKATVPKAKRRSSEPGPVGSRQRARSAGEHVYGSKKDLRTLAHEIQTGKRTLDLSDLENLDYADAAYLVTKQNLLTPATLDSLRKDGKTPGCAVMTMAVLASIKNKAPDTDEGRRNYIEDVRLVQGTLNNCQTAQDVNSAITEWATTRRSAPKWDVKETRISSRAEALKRADVLSKETGYLHNAVFDFRSGTHQVVSKAAKPFDSLGAKFNSVLDARRGRGKGGKHVKEAWVLAREADQAGDGGWEYLRHQSVLKGQSKEERQQKTKERQKRRKAEGLGFTELGISTSKLSAGEVAREGGRVQVKKANAQRTKRTFDLVQVQAGEAISDSDFAYHTKALEEGFHDLADVLEVDPKVIGLNGRLAVAIAARGAGRAAAHYESHKKIINLTKLSGGGSLAHEWGHALDNVLAEHFTSKTSGLGTYLSDQRDNADIPQKLRASIQKVWSAMVESPDPKKTRARMVAEKEKWATKERELVRKNNSYVRELNSINRKLSASDVKRVLASYEQKAEKLKGGAGEDFYKKRIERIKSGEDVRTPEDEVRAITLEEEIAFLRPTITTVRKHKNGYAKLAAQARSDFWSNSVAADGWKSGGYHSSSWELFARAFEAYTKDKLSKSGRKNTYLVSAVESDIYPKGEERGRVYEAFDEMMAHLRDTGLMMKAMLDLFTVPLERAVKAGV
jgi:hypothetical protein